MAWASRTLNGTAGFGEKISESNTDGLAQDCGNSSVNELELTLTVLH